MSIPAPPVPSFPPAPYTLTSVKGLRASGVRAGIKPSGNPDVALLVADATERWPYAFLDEANIPSDFAQAMKQSSLKAGPDLAVSSMVPREIDLGAITEAAGTTLETIERVPVVRVLLLWGVFVAVLMAVFLATR